MDDVILCAQRIQPLTLYAEGRSARVSYPTVLLQSAGTAPARVIAKLLPRPRFFSIHAFYVTRREITINLNLDWLVDRQIPAGDEAQCRRQFARERAVDGCACRGDDYTPDYLLTQTTWLDPDPRLQRDPEFLSQRRRAGRRQLSGWRRRDLRFPYRKAADAEQTICSVIRTVQLRRCSATRSGCGKDGRFGWEKQPPQPFVNLVQHHEGRLSRYPTAVALKPPGKLRITEICPRNRLKYGAGKPFQRCWNYKTEATGVRTLFPH